MVDKTVKMTQYAGHGTEKEAVAHTDPPGPG